MLKLYYTRYILVALVLSISLVAPVFGKVANVNPNDFTHLRKKP